MTALTLSPSTLPHFSHPHHQIIDFGSMADIEALNACALDMWVNFVCLGQEGGGWRFEVIHYSVGHTKTWGGQRESDCALGGVTSQIKRLSIRHGTRHALSHSHTLSHTLAHMQWIYIQRHRPGQPGTHPQEPLV